VNGRANAGHEVWITARGGHAAAIRERGLELRGHDGVARAGPDALHLLGLGTAPPLPAELVVMGEKNEWTNWYFFANTDEYANGAEPYKHGVRRGRGSNYLFLDLHVTRQWPGPDQ
jgi:prepilin-type processing-associated H-X9-DG protein